MCEILGGGARVPTGLSGSLIFRIIGEGIVTGGDGGSDINNVVAVDESKWFFYQDLL